MGWNASDTRPLSFDDCRVPEENLLGPRGMGFKQFLQTLDGGRISVSAMGVGLAQGALDEALAYAKERQAFGQAISKYQAIQIKLADMSTEIEAARLLTYKAAIEKDEGKNFNLTAAQAKLKTGRLAVRAAEEAVQIHGGYGYIEEYPVCRFYRDAKILTIGEGTDEVQQMVIARSLGVSWRTDRAGAARDRRVQRSRRRGVEALTSDDVHRADARSLEDVTYEGPTRAGLLRGARRGVVRARDGARRVHAGLRPESPRRAARSASRRGLGSERDGPTEGGPMFASVRTYRTDPEKLGELLHILTRSSSRGSPSGPACARTRWSTAATGSWSRSAASARATRPSTRPTWRASSCTERLSDFEIERTDVMSGAGARERRRPGRARAGSRLT